MQKKKSFWQVILGVLLGLFFCCLLPYQGVWIGCLWWNCAPERDISLWSLEMPPDYFPEGADVGPLLHTPGHSISDDTFADEYSQWIEWGSGRSSYNVWEYVSVNRAFQGYEKLIKINYFFSTMEEGEWQKSIIEYKSDVADESFITCGIGIWDNECIFRGRYEEYYISFMSTIDEEMNSEEYIEILSYIEEKITTLLSS
ncbi:MAG: hypothetical protein PVF83_09880 [Anaerolineales bacterium]|jgi:hypothetical protein